MKSLRRWIRWIPLILLAGTILGATGLDALRGAQNVKERRQEEKSLGRRRARLEERREALRSRIEKLGLAWCSVGDPDYPAELQQLKARLNAAGTKEREELQKQIAYLEQILQHRAQQDKAATQVVEDLRRVETELVELETSSGTESQKQTN